MPWYAIDYVKHSILIDPRWQQSFKWSGTALIALSAALVSFSPALSQQSAAFLGFFLGHVLWSTMGIIKRDWPLIAVNAFFIPLDLYAMYIRL